MKVWRPKRKKSENEALIAQAQVVPARREEVQRVRISRVHMAAAAPVVVGLGLLVLFPFLIADAGGPPAIGRTPSGRDPAPEPTPVDPRPVAETPARPTRPANGGGETPPPGPAADPELEQAMAAVLDASIRYEERVPSLDRLARSRDPRARDALLAAAASRDPDTRVLAGLGLARRLPDPRASDALRLLLQDGVEAVAEATAIELGKGSVARDLLVGRLQLADPGGQIHLTCIRGLVYQGTADDVPLLMRWTLEPGRLGEAAVETVWSICTRTGYPPPPGLPKRLR